MSIQLDKTYDILNKSKHISIRAACERFFLLPFLFYPTNKNIELMCIFQISLLLLDSEETGAISLSATFTVDQSESTQSEFVKLSVWLAAKLGFPNH